jgi:hypothetical protein
MDATADDLVDPRPKKAPCEARHHALALELIDVLHSLDAF